ncbi:hypothetical protein FRC04_006762 [Tulasnella sp. 424]|nr:hypothetical protein FRC04_006762 [Tulasnella sp. 424]KAG8974312.1 hypothetical protein FRC05_007618 [Tulasnella sp. 425]
MAIDALPPEILIRVLSYLPLQAINSFSLVSKFCHDVVSTNENAIYQAAATFHDFIESPKQQSRLPLLTEVVNRPDATGWMDNVTSWKELCKRHFLREYAWTGTRLGDNLGEQLNLKVLLPSSLKNVHRFKVDEVERTVLCSTSKGGLLVASIDTEEVLWQLPRRYVSPFAHVEYDQGFIVFTRRDNGVEVWRRSADSFNRRTYLTCNPSPGQVAASPYPVPRFPENFPPIYDMDSINPANRGQLPSLPRRGVYLPFALINPPARTRASRFVYPHLAVASETAHKAYIWDVPTSSLIQTIQIDPLPQPGDFGLPQIIYYVELNEDFVFVCWSFCLMVYHRAPQNHRAESTTSNLVFSLGLESATARDPARTVLGDVPDSLFKVDLPSPSELEFGTSTPQISYSRPYPVTQLNTPAPNMSQLLWDDFAAVHVSPDGRDLVTVTQAGWLLYIPDFQVGLSSARTSPPFKICFSERETKIIQYLAFDGKRILFALNSAICAITVRDLLHPKGSRRDPQIRHLATIPPAQRLDGGPQVSCIQLHGGSAWFTFTPLDDEEGNLAYVDLTTSAT